MCASKDADTRALGQFPGTLSRQSTAAPWVLRGFQNEIANNGKDSALWHTTCTAACGDRLVQTVNGFCTSDLVDPACEKTGRLGLQMHGGTDCEMFFKDFEVLPITPAMRKLIERQ